VELDYLRARYLDVAAGRFFGRDPLDGSPESPISLHRFLYASSNPVNVADPSGQFGISTVVVTALLIPILLVSFPIKFEPGVTSEIDVNFRPIPLPPPLSVLSNHIYHSYILVKQQGQPTQYYAAFPSNQNPVNGDYGYLKGIHETYSPSMTAQADYYLPVIVSQRYTALGKSAEYYENSFEKTLEAITDNMIPYNPYPTSSNPVAPNSNSAVHTMLVQAGITPKAPPFYTAGWDTKLL
jgi:hypothetical protein